MAERRPNILVIMTDEERYPPPYEDEALRQWRRDNLPARERLRAAGVELHRHYTASTACVPSRTSLFTGQYPSLHGVAETDGIAKRADDPAMIWLDPDGVPTLGDWFRAGGYRTFYKGKWHITRGDLPIPGEHHGLMANDREGNPLPEGLDAYERADRLDPFGFSGWIGREPHGPNPADAGIVKDPIYADQVTGLFADLAADDGDDSPWLAVASFVNPHDIVFTGGAWMMFGLPDTPDTLPPIPAAPSQADGFDSRPAAQEAFRHVWPAMLYEQPTDLAYRQFYLWLHELVDEHIGRVLDALDESGMANDTIIVFTSDHGDMMGAHGGMQQKWHSAFDEAIRVPLVVTGPGIASSVDGWHVPTSHIDLVPTLLGLAGIDPVAVEPLVAAHHVETRPPVGRDLSAALRGDTDPATAEAPVYFMTEDEISQGLRQQALISGKPFTAVPAPARVEAVIATRPTGDDGAPELWKLTHFYDRLAEWEEAVGIAPVFPPEPVDDEWELYNLTTDPEERTNLAAAGGDTLAQLQALLIEQRLDKRLVPRLRNP